MPSVYIAISHLYRSSKNVYKIVNVYIPSVYIAMYSEASNGYVLSAVTLIQIFLNIDIEQTKHKQKRRSLKNT